MIVDYLWQALIIGVMVILSVRLLIEVHNRVTKCRSDFNKVAQLEIMDPKPMRMPRNTDPKESEDEEHEEEASEVANNENHFDNL